MKKLFTLALLMLCMCLNAQNNDEWKSYSFGDYCSLSVPNTMELRDPSSATGSFIDKNVRRATIKFGDDAPSKRIVFQPKGMNSSDPQIVHAANSKYARIIVELISSDGITQSDIDYASASDIAELNSRFYDSYLSDIKLLGQAIDQFKWYPLKRVKYSGRNALVLHFKRPGLQGAVDVTEYRFFLRGLQLRIVVSYRESESSIWAVDFSNVIPTIKFK